MRTIIIIGASSSIGKELAKCYGRTADTRLGLIARREHELQALALQLPATCEILKLDLTQSDAPRPLKPS